ncbi:MULTISPECIES: tripartite tricarboxylate transporter permease [unclassified Symbiopectobacterium]|uniref:tripartite tricarboxylate transporter permease n=1 Tax=unclassified Symbiopectobacterium TaxID=2794573 RepID=UPI002226E887|nr:MULTISPECIES: tripartite tricarboxylate transporter permease [unclassified Symbiopectobacterium]MCW2475575.1 tripartite tricarboxylate transporter permease [Candidatus Symbiopectobacterium sp. NZEC151]MCW2486242.1 tripartite tricarboxylate transporter permease [Candidatus Symbiopectobacterium sp. NZEC127]
MIPDVWQGLFHGLSIALLPNNLFYCFCGALFGTLVGVLPGVGPLVTIALLLPFTFTLEPTSALIMLAGIYYGAQYGGSTTSILLNMPGETSSVITCLDGHAMAKQGRAGPALAIAALGSFFAGTLATFVIGFFSPSLASMAIRFGPADYFSLLVLGLIGAVVLAQGSLLKAITMVVVGLLLGLVGTDINSGELRFTFGIPELADGIDFVPLAMGVFGIGEIIRVLVQQEKSGGTVIEHGKLMPSAQDIRQATPAVLRGSLLGSVLGLLPGGGAALASFAAYTVEKKLAKDPSRFGKGAIEGVAAPESANNAAAQTSFIPLLTLGLPSNAIMALMVGAMMIHGINPGPRIMQSEPDLFWGMVASMWVGNAMLLVLNLPMVGVWVRLLKIPYRLFYPAIVLFSCVGIYSVSNNPFDLFLAALFALLGYTLAMLRFELAPLLLGFILGPMMEENLRRALIISRGDFGIFVHEPISLGLLIASGLLLLITLAPMVRLGRDKIFVE